MIRNLDLEINHKIYQVTLDIKSEIWSLEKFWVTLDGHRLFVDEISYIENRQNRNRNKIQNTKRK
jgi:23S rRNA pseudouridine2605 synthase